ncbi:hypothetical protein G3A39_39335 [Paraburkholderia aspalathi]|nr:hypothetical protein [Paraburkholderia aspalathi]
MEVVEYYMSIHMGIAAGPLDSIQAIIVDKKDAWTGSATTQTDIRIDRSDLFGGLKKEGGVSGTATYLPGDRFQTIPEYLAAKLGLTTDTCPAYRGISSVFFHGGSFAYGNRFSVNSGGFYWRANSPYLPGTWIIASRSPKVLDSSTAMIGPDANGAHIIYECLVNTDWGMGSSSNAINIQSFNDCATTLFNEKFGISFLWTQQETIENFITNIINHVEGVIFVNPNDGLITMKLIRDDYNPDTLFTITPDNAEMSNFQRKLWAETVNEVVVSRTNPESEEKETVTIQDLGNIAIQGGVVSTSKDYEGIRNADLAMFAAARDLRVASAPMASCEVIVNRSAWKVVPGSVVKIRWPEHGMMDVLMRVGLVDYGQTNDSKIRLSLAEDIFSLPQADYHTPPPSGWIDPSENPRPMVYSMGFTLPYMFAASIGTDLASIPYPNVVSGVLGAQPGMDTNQFVLAYEVTNAAGGLVVQEGETLSITSRALIDSELNFEITSIMALNGMTQGSGVAQGTFAILGTHDENMEICVVTNVIGNIITMNRGALDTTPKAWPRDTPIWFVDEDSAIADGELRVGGQSVEYWLLPSTSKGTLKVADANITTATLTDRPWMPTRPANVKIKGIAAGTVDAIGDTTIPITWATRNRTLEDTIALRWNETSVPPETGQTTTITVLDAVGNVLSTIDDLPGTGHDLPSSAFVGKSGGIVRVTAKRDGIESLQGHEIRVMVAEGGYGLAYGLNYGG